MRAAACSRIIHWRLASTIARWRAYRRRCKQHYLPKNIRSNTAAVATDLTAIRTRAGLGAVAPTLARIRQEHRVELAMEHDRFFDLVRQEAVQPDRIVPIFAAQGKTFTKGKNEFFIPQAQLDFSGGALTQNPGY